MPLHGTRAGFILSTIFACVVLVNQSLVVVVKRAALLVLTFSLGACAGNGSADGTSRDALGSSEPSSSGDEPSASTGALSSAEVEQSVPFLFERILGAATPSDLRLRGQRESYLLIDHDWRYWVYSPATYAESQSREFRLSALGAWAPVKTGVVPEGSRAEIAANLKVSQWELLSGENPGAPAPDQGNSLLSNGTAELKCGGECSPTIASLIEVASELSSELYEAGTDFDGAVSVHVLEAKEDEVLPDAVFEEPPEGFEPAALLEHSDGSPSVGVEIDDPAVVSWLREKRQILLEASPPPERHHQYVGVRVAEVVYKVYFRDLPPHVSAEDGSFDLSQP
jgi:hypothetical protein